MDEKQMWADAYVASLRGVIAYYGVIEKEDEYRRMQQFCEKSAQDAARAFTQYTQKSPE